jgi:hypothetical protein
MRQPDDVGVRMTSWIRSLWHSWQYIEHLPEHLTLGYAGFASVMHSAREAISRKQRQTSCWFYHGRLQVDGVLASIIFDDFFEVGETLLKADPQVQKLCKDFGIDSMDSVAIDPWPSESPMSARISLLSTHASHRAASI